VPVFDAYGVDLVFSGHSHGYERSFLVKGHVGKSDTLEPSMLVDDGDGDPDGDGAYQKLGVGPVPNQGVVYTVAGSAATLNSAPYDHPVMVSSHESLGSVVLDIGSHTLDAKFIAQDGSVLDHFQIHKHPVDVPALRPIAQMLLCTLVALGSANLLLRRRRRAGRGGTASRPAA